MTSIVRAGVARRALLASTAIAIGFAAASQAQAQDADEAANDDSAGTQAQPAVDGETIVVTGSYIRNKEYTTSSPVEVVSSAELSAVGAMDLKDSLKTLTINTGSQLADETSNAKGVSQFNLRGLGLGGTLTLINGRRAGFAALSDSAGAEFVDINQFPLSMIERMEVLKDGASATYGSEAVAGVVNIVTRKGFEGLEVSGNFAAGHNEAFSLSFASGMNFDRGSFNVYGTYYKQNQISRTDLDWYDDRILGGGDRSLSRLLSTTGAPGSYLRAFINSDGDPALVPGAQRITDPDCLAAGGVFRQNADGSFDTSRCRYDFSEQLVVAQNEQRMMLFTEFEYELTDSIKFYSEVSHARNVATSPQGPNFYNNGVVAGSGAIFIPGDHPFNFFIADPSNATGIIYIGPDAWDPAIHTGVDLVCECRPLGAEFGGNNSIRYRRQELNYSRYMGGLEFNLPSDWLLNASYQHASNTANVRFGEEYRADVFNNLVIDGVFNPFGTRLADPDLVSPKDGVSTAVNEQEVIDLFDQYRREMSVSTQNVVDVIATGDVFDFGAGPVAVAVGGQYRAQSILIMPDTRAAAGEGNSPGIEFPVDDSTDVWAVFGEAVLPPLFNDTVNIQLAVRHEEFGERAGSTTDPKVSVKFAPADFVSFRGSWGTSFQAPSMFQLAETGSSAVIDDTAVPGPNGAVCGVGGSTNFVNVYRSGAGLKPQSSKNLNLGVIFDLLSGLKLSVDYWDYNYKDLIAPSESAQAILINDCLDDGIPNDPRVIRGSTGQISRINTTFTNVGKVNASGIDVGLSYRLASTPAGTFTLDIDATYVDKFIVDDGTTSYNAAGSRNFLNNFGAQPKLRANGSLGWIAGNHNVNATVRYIDSYKNDQSNDAPIKSFTTVDLQYALALNNSIGGGETMFRVGVNNLFDVDPPALRRYDANGEFVTGIDAIDRPASDLTVHDIRGRILYAGFTHKF